MDEDGDEDDEWSPGSCSIALFPFWCLDAKGGEVVLLGCPRGLFARVGHKRVFFIISWELVPIYRALFAFRTYLVEVCSVELVVVKTMLLLVLLSRYYWYYCQDIYIGIRYS
jgi:hypothetical protein